MTMMVAGQAIQSIMGGYAQDEQYARQDMAFQQQELQRQLDIDQKNFVINQQNANRLINNRQLAISASKQLEAQMQDIRDSYQANSRGLSQQMASAKSNIKSNIGGRNMDPTSGSAAALLRMAQTTARQSYTNLTRQTNIAKRNAETQFENIMNKRDLNMQSSVHFLPGVSPAGDPGSAITAGWLGAAGTVIGGSLGGKPDANAG